MKPRTCVTPSGRFVYGIHKPSFTAENFRENDFLAALGTLPDGAAMDNRRNFPEGAVTEEGADWIYEIPNPFPFRGTTYIARRWAEARRAAPEKMKLPSPAAVSLSSALEKLLGSAASPADIAKAIAAMPEPVLLATASTSTDPADLTTLAKLSCEFTVGEDGEPAGLRYRKTAAGAATPVIENHALFEAVVNNRHLPDRYKQVMVLRPGVQGGSEVVGEWTACRGKSHIFEYLRRNSYIPWGHYAANMADDAVRYRAEGLTRTDMAGLRHLYYQRTYACMAAELGLAPFARRQMADKDDLERMRLSIVGRLSIATERPFFTASLWGWNYGFDYAASGYRLHASHQMIHQQYALLPAAVPAWHAAGVPAEPDRKIPSYGCGDLVADFIAGYRKETGQNFFSDYIGNIRANRRMDGDAAGEASLVIHEDPHVMLFVPKAQTSQWEIQLMTLAPVGNVLEADSAVRDALDRGISTAMKILAGLGAKMVTTIEYSKRFDVKEKEQHLLYSFLPRMPESPGAFSEAQLRWINGHYPEDFAAACRSRL